MARLETWFKTERMHRHEVRGKTIATRLKFELEYARDQELVLQQHPSPEFKPFVLARCQEKLQFFQIVRPSKRRALDERNRSAENRRLGPHRPEAL